MGASPLPAPSQVVEFLQRGASYPDGPDRVETIETHLSFVFLAGSHAYKLKKPVRFEFVDFSTVEARRAACEEELRLNRRLAANVYERVLPITADAQGNLAIDGAGTAVDWVVQMRRFDEANTLESAIRSGRLQTAEVDALCDVLLGFYRQTGPAEISAPEFLAQIERHVRANLGELLRPEHALDSPTVRRIHAGQLRLLKLAPALFDARVEARRIVEGHGDLRPEHVVLESPPVVIDCLEFSRELRTLDVLDELCFLAMECERLGSPVTGQRVLDRYRHSTGDAPPPALVAFYQSYRACVRGKVAALRAGQASGPDRQTAHELAERYLRLANDFASELGPPTLIVVGGLSGTGKSTLAARLADELAAVHLQTDIIRQELFGPSDPNRSSDDRYQAANRAKVYETMLAQAGDALAQGVPVILDGTFLTTQACAAAIAVAHDYDGKSLLVRCICPASIATERIAHRLAHGDSASEAHPELHRQQQEELEPLPAEPPSIEIDTTLPLEQQVTAVLARLAPLVFPTIN